MKAVDSIINEKGSWVNVESELQQVVATSTLGKRLFGFAVQQVLSTVVSNKMNDAIAAVMQQDLVTTDKIIAAKKTCIEQVESMQNIETLPTKRVIKVAYRGVEVSIKVTDIAEEFDMRAAASIKSDAAASGDLIPLFCEAELVKKDVLGTKGKIHADLLKQSQEARTLANAELLGDACKDGETIKAFGGNANSQTNDTIFDIVMQRSVMVRCVSSHRSARKTQGNEASSFKNLSGNTRSQ